ncbi:MAG TPA: FmdE family protein [Methanocella sp.]|nr:FmdE family protein [Methanocella sp.]
MYGPNDQEHRVGILPFSSAVRFHGHICPGLAIGYYASYIAMRWLYAEQAKGMEVAVITETAGCPLDAIQVITGCTLGKGNLIIHDHGKLTFTFVSRESGRGVRVSLKAGLYPEKLDPGLHDLQEKTKKGIATPEESVDLQHRIERICRTILESPGEQMFNIREVTIRLPVC